MNWQDISTAPKDGTPILGLGPAPGRSGGWIEARETVWENYGVGSPGYAAYARGEGPLGVGWRWSEPLHNWGSQWKPTHWQPMPPTPGSESAKPAAPAPQELAARILAALETPACERLRDFYAIGPVQRAAVDAFVDAMPNEWREAVLDELAIACLDAPLDESPRSIIKRVIQWHIAVALDPAVSSQAQALIDRGRAQVGDNKKTT